MIFYIITSDGDVMSAIVKAVLLVPCDKENHSSLLGGNTDPCPPFKQP